MTARRAHHGHHRDRGRYGNSDDLERFVARQLDPARAAWQKPATVVKALGLRAGQTVAEIGAGPGFWTLRLARAVGPSGHVYAVEPEPAIIDVLRQRLERAGIRNVSPVLGRGDDPLLPPAQVDVALMVNAYHHLDDGPAFLRRVARALRPGGRLANIDFDKRETPVGPPVEHRVAREAFVREAERAGLGVVAEHRGLPYQYFLVLRRCRRRHP